MGTYSEWDEVKKLEFLTKELKGKRPLVPPTIEVKIFQKYIGVNRGLQGIFNNEADVCMNCTQTYIARQLL